MSEKCSTISCAVCRDLAPLVQDGVASTDSTALVHAHLADCADCRALFPQLLQGEPQQNAIPQPDDARVLRRIRTRILLWVALGLILGNTTFQWNVPAGWQLLFFPLLCGVATWLEDGLWKLVLPLASGLAFLRQFFANSNAVLRPDADQARLLLERVTWSVIVGVAMLALCAVGVAAAGLLKKVYKGGKRRWGYGLLGGLLVVSLLLAGVGAIQDPLGRAWAEQRALKLAQELYPGQEFAATHTSVGHNFRYMVTVASATSPDTVFTVETNLGQLSASTDDHIYRVEQRNNTKNRLETEATALAVELLQENAPQWPVLADDATGKMTWLSVGWQPPEADSTGGYDKTQLPLDVPLTTGLLQTVPSCLTVHLWMNTAPTAADLQAAQHTVKQVMEENGWPVTYYHVILCSPGDNTTVYTDSDVLHTDDIA